MSTPPQNQSGRVEPGGTSHGDSRADGGQSRTSAHDLADQARSEGKARADEMRGSATHAIDALADGARAAASEMRGDDVGHLSEYVSELADGMSRFSSNLRDKSGDEIVRDVGRMARENPALFVAGSIAIGFGISRFARASSPSARSDASAGDSIDRSDYSSRTAQPSDDYASTSAYPGSTAMSGSTGASQTTPSDQARSDFDRSGPSPGKHGGLHS